MASKQLVLGDLRLRGLRQTTRPRRSRRGRQATDDIKLKSVGVLVLDDNGKIKVDKVGRRSTFKGAGIGVILAMATPIGMAAGVVGGAALGALHHKGLGDLRTTSASGSAASSPAARRPSGSSRTPPQTEAISDKLS